MGPIARKFGLTAHIVSSVGWLGAVCAFLALAIGGLKSDDPQAAAAAYLAMKWLTGFVIVPAAVASLFSGVIQALGTPWGLVRHYWVVVKLAVTVLALFVLLLHTSPIDYMAAVAKENVVAVGSERPVQIQLAVTSAAAALALLVATGLAVYKPRGRTPGSRRRAAPGTRAPS